MAEENEELKAEAKNFAFPAFPHPSVPSVISVASVSVFSYNAPAEGFDV